MLTGKRFRYKYNSMRIITLVFSLSFSALLWSCGGGNKQSVEEKSEGALSSDMERFTAFYQRFHRDSLYQINHIIFPLEGLPDDADSATIASGRFRWQKEDWQMQRPFDFDMSDFGREFKQPGPGLVEEIIYHKKLPYVLIRRFSWLGDDWYLIYYAGMNKIKVEE